MGLGETLLIPKEIDFRLQSLELANSEFKLNITTLQLSNAKLNQEVNHLKTQVAELLESKCEIDEANQNLENVQDQAECEY